MSFADELRQAPDKKKREEERQRQLQIEQQEKDLKRLASEWNKYIHEACKRTAEEEKSSYSSEFSRFIECMEKTFKSDHQTSDWWKRVDPRIHYTLNPKSDRETICLNKEDIENLESIIKGRLEMDGLSVNTEIREYQSYQIEYVYVKRSDTARAINSLFNLLTDGFDLDEEGEYKPRRVAGEVRYGLTVSVSW